MLGESSVCETAAENSSGSRTESLACPLVSVHTLRVKYIKTRFHEDLTLQSPNTGNTGPMWTVPTVSLINKYNKLITFLQAPNADGTNGSVSALGVSMETNLRKSYPSVRHVNGVINRSVDFFFLKILLN